MEKKIKVLLWTIVGIVAAILIGSVVLAFTTPSHLITLWLSLIFGAGLCAVWTYRKTLKNIGIDLAAFADKEVTKEEEAKEEVEETADKKKEVAEEEKAAPKAKKAVTKKRSTKKK